MEKKDTTKAKFVHLHTHSHFSLLDGLTKIKDMVKFAKEDGMPAIALTDHGNMYGAIEFYKECKKNDIKPIIGVEFYVTHESRHDKRAGIDNQRFHLTLLAKNKVGYKNLIKLVTISNLEGFYYRPRVDKEILKKYSDGIVCLSACFGGELPRALRNKNYEKAKKIALEHQEIYGKENYFLEIMHHPSIENFEEVRDGIVKISKELDIPLVATQDSHYLLSEDARAQETLLAVQTNSSLQASDRFSMASEDYSFINTKTACKYFKNYPEAVSNTLKVADMCNLEIELGNWVFPNFEIPDGKTYSEVLREETYKGIEDRGLKRDDVVIERIEYELKIIKDKGYCPYFLVVSDLLKYAQSKNILTNTRGSAAGSLVAYLTRITSVNPLELRLPFERFLNPERPSAPDIDMDFADNRRDEVIEYARQKYGEDKVAQIGTFGTMAARGSVRDVARALGHPYDLGDKISKLIPLGSQGFPMTIKTAMEMTPELKDMYKKEKDVKEIIDLAKKLEGCVRHISVHAAGVVIAPTLLEDFVPVQLDPKDGTKIITQYDMYSIEEAGLLKFDFLGIRNLAILGDAVRLVKKFYNKEIDLDNLPKNDPKTYAMLARGETMGLFQLNGSGMTRYLKELKPTNIDDINAMIALYRPGPLAFIPEYIKRKQNPKLVRYIDPRLKEIIEPTFGIIIYQDDILLIATKIAGYSWGEADKFRKAMGKKIPKEMEAQKEKFFKGCIDGGMKPDVTKELWEMIETFAAYGFNKAHTASYGQVAYQTSYMKANYPVEYMTAVLTAESGDTDKIAIIIDECKRMDIPVLPPDINESFGNFTVIKKEGEKDKIRFGLYTIKNLGTDISNAIIAERKENGKFESFSNFLERIKHKNLNKKSLDALTKCGAMDELGERGQIIFNMEDALEYNKQAINDASQSSLFSLMSDDKNIPEFRLKETEPANATEKLGWEKELLGLYISGHPLDKFRDKLEKSIAIKKMKESAREGTTTIIAGIVTEARVVITKTSNAQMAFIKIADLTDNIEVVVFPKTFTEFKDFIEPETCIALRGKISKRNDELSIIADKIKRLE